MSDPAQLQAAIEAQGLKVRQLKSEKAQPADIKLEVDALLSLKSQLKALGIDDAPARPPKNSGSAAGGKSKDASGSAAAGAAAASGKYALKTPKGTRDWDPLSMALRSKIFSTVTGVFEKHGAVTIDTPVFELKEILSGKYGEDSKLIYDLQDQGGELCSLRYDLTVPFARFVAMNPSEYGSIKRYHIAKVYRRDQPAMSKGRFREFYQCDFDIAGVYDPMVPDAEILLILTEALDALGIEGFTIKLNHRKILDGIFDVCGVPEDKIRTISSAVDKLDKSPWEEVKREMVVDKGLEEAIADEIGKYVGRKGGKDLLAELQADAKLSSNKRAKEGLDDMELLFSFLDVFGILNRTSFDLSLARGLDYYTGIIYEAVTAESARPGFSKEGGTQSNAAAVPPPSSNKKNNKSKKGGEEEEIDESSVGVGSIAAGGRYDHLVGMFSGSKKPDAVPCVGVSVGVERVFAIMMARLKEKEAKGIKSDVRAKPIDAFVMSMGGDGFLKERMSVAKRLWDAGIKAEYLYKTKPKPAPQFTAMERDGVPLAIILAPDEWAKGVVRVKEQKAKALQAGGAGVGGGEGEEKANQADANGEVVELERLAEYVRVKLGRPSDK